MFDISLLLSAVSASSPCGDDLEYDTDFLQLERDAEGRPERTMGDSVQAAEPPQWQQTQQASFALLQRSKDLRIASYFLQSSIALDGIAGLTNGLSLINELLRQYWPSLHPQPDADDNNDATVRTNALCAIACDVNMRLLGESHLASSPVFGPVSLRAALNASGLQGFRDEKLTADELAGALRNSDPERLRSTYSALSEALSTTETIERYVSEQVGSAQGVDLSALKTALKHALQILGKFSPSNDINNVTELTPSAAISTSTPTAVIGEIGHRDDVLRCLDRALAYYARHEPSSPLPVLLNRAKSLVHADFATIVRNLIPDGVSQLEILRGPSDD